MSALSRFSDGPQVSRLKESCSSACVQERSQRTTAAAEKGPTQDKKTREISRVARDLLATGLFAGCGWDPDLDETIVASIESIDPLTGARTVTQYDHSRRRIDPR